MANSLFAEHNRAAWVGVRPGVFGEQVIAYAEIIAVDTVLYTVPAGKTLFLFDWWLSVVGLTAAALWGLKVYTGGAALSSVLGVITQFTAVGGGAVTGANYTVPAEIPEAYTIRAIRSAAGVTISCGIKGLLVDNLETE